MNILQVPKCFAPIQMFWSKSKIELLEHFYFLLYLLNLATYVVHFLGNADESNKKFWKKM